ncbi:MULTISPECIES: folate family ECF transporter S component [Fructilactobacillus]|uniref:Folate family ECF transporter S component n=1 Tax=Fructilactobacillus carniphilus TaxID=2940297 RepID=A0ABY5BZQ1_9LACO|nr:MULTISPECIES: folate family ECF transporter S component [Fructilactobacillus]USS86017.1 folate family ECF transporter S component [Fructilactobacillus cliffordii]USS90520.1 folate family ECF transporter S component [Fructilactobacillus carniphilus]
MNFLRKWGLRPLSLKGMTYLAILMAIEIIVGRFVIGSSSVQFSFTFIVIALIAKWYGPFWSTGVAVIVDFISTLFSGQPYFPGFALSAILVSLIYSIGFFQQKRISWPRVIIVVALITVFINLILNSWWVSIIAHTPFSYFFGVRLGKNLISFPIQTVLLYWVLNNRTIQNLKPTIFK